MFEDICSYLSFGDTATSFFSEKEEDEAKTKKKRGLKGILRRKKKEKQPIYVKNKPEPEAKAPPEYKWDMEEMTFVGEVIRDDFVTPLSQDITIFQHNMIEQCCDDGVFESDDEATAEQSLHQLQQKYQKQHPGLLMRDDSDTITNSSQFGSDDSSQSSERVSNHFKTFTSNFSPRARHKKTLVSTKGIRAQGTTKKTTGKNGTLGIRVQRTRSSIGRK